MTHLAVGILNVDIVKLDVRRMNAYSSTRIITSRNRSGHVHRERHPIPQIRKRIPCLAIDRHVRSGDQRLSSIIARINEECVTRERGRVRLGNK
jgi:hypothetical protein